MYYYVRTAYVQQYVQTTYKHVDYGHTCRQHVLLSLIVEQKQIFENVEYLILEWNTKRIASTIRFVFEILIIHTPLVGTLFLARLPFTQKWKTRPARLAFALPAHLFAKPLL